MTKKSYILLIFGVCAGVVSSILVITDSKDGLRGEMTVGMLGLVVPFISNEGQTDSMKRFHTPFLGGEVAVTEQGDIIYDFPGITLTESVVRGNKISLKGEDRSATRVNYYIGNDSANWRQNIPAYKAVSFGEVYPGIDLRLSMRGGNVEKLFTVNAGISPDTIQMKLKGTSALRVDEQGRLEVDTPRGVVHFTKPVAYQEIGDGRQYVQVAYNVVDDNSYGFTLGDYNRSYPLVIDPLLVSTFVDGPSFNHWGIDYAPVKRINSDDEVGSIFLAGDRGVPPGFEDEEESLDPKTALDIYVAKFDTEFSVLEAYTVIGSSEYADIGAVLSLSRDKSWVYVAGRTYGPDFPVTADAYDTTFNSEATETADGYVIKLTTNLEIVAATFIGGSAEETQSHWLDFDWRGNVYFGGKTVSTDFPVTAGAYDSSYNGGAWDAYVAKLSPDLSTLLASTLFGGQNEDVTRNAQLDKSGNLVFTGQTMSPDLPVTAAAYDTDFNGDRDFYVAKLNNDFTQLLASTYVGGTTTDFPSYLRIDPLGYVNIVGYTMSPEFPVTEGAYDTTHAGIFDGVFVRMDPQLSSIVKSTFFGGSDVDLAFAFDMDKHGNIYVTGRTRSPDYPITPKAHDTTWNGDFDAMVTVFDYGLTRLKSSTFVGGKNLDMAFAIMWDHDFVVYLAGVTGSPDFETTAGAYNRIFKPTNTAFALKINMRP